LKRPLTKQEFEYIHLLWRWMRVPENAFGVMVL